MFDNRFCRNLFDPVAIWCGWFMKVSPIKSLITVSCLLLVAVRASAEDKPVAEAPSPRYSLGAAATPGASAVSGELTIRTNSPAIDSSLPPPSAFEWKALTAHGPAAGSDPIVGAGGGKPYYDFKDGQPYPFYVYTRSRS